MKQIFASFGLQRQKQIRKAALISFGVVVVLTLTVIAVKVLKEQTKAITGDGENITLTKGTEISYGTWVTHRYTVTTEGEQKVAFCADPAMDAPNSGTYKADKVASTDKNKKIKLIIYMFTHQNSVVKPVLDDWFRELGVSSSADKYAYIHATIGYINDGVTTGLSSDEATIIMRLDGWLGDHVDNPYSKPWAMAKDFQLYRLDPSGIGANEQNIMWVENNRRYGQLNIKKCDTLNTTCTPAGAASFNNVTYEVSYAGDSMIYNEKRGEEGTFYGGTESRLVGRFTTGPNGTVLVDRLSVGDYTVKEISEENPSLIFVPSEQTVSINANEISTKIFKNEIVRADLEFRKIDDDGRPMANIPFKIKSYGGEEHIVVTDQNGIVDTRKYAHSNHTNGYDNMDVNAITDLGYGTWFGKDGPNAQTPIDDSLGALPFDTYTITEIACNNNDHCYDVSGQSKTFTVGEESAGAHVSLGDWNNDCVNYTVETTATDNEDGDKIISSKQNAQIKDRVEYCVKKNTTYKLVGTLVDGSGLPIIDVGARQEVDINPGNQECGTVDMVFTFDARHLGGQDVVVYEKIYKPTDMTNPVASHTEATNQTVSVFTLETIATDANDEAGTTAAKSIEDKPDQKIKDSIDYCLKAGTSYTLKGILMDKETGEKLTINGETFEKSVNITPSANCGKAELIFDLDASELKGKRIVVYEYAYEGETLVEKHENINDENQTIAVYSLGTKATDLADDNQSIEAAANQTIKDSVEFCLTSNRTYTLKGVLMDKATRERVLIDGEPIEKSLNITPSTDCGIAELDFGIDATEFAGKQIIVFETLYEGEEEIIKHEDFEDQNQTIDIYSLETTASDPADGDKDVLGTTESKIKDTIDYCLTAGKEYTVKGILMDKDTKKPLMVNGGTIENSITFTPSENCGTIEMEFTLDASHLKGIEIVVFESVYLGTDLVIEHNDIDDESQAVYIYIPPPNTGSFTGSTAAGKQDSVSNNTFPVIIIGAIALAGLGIGCGFFLRRKSVKFN